MRHRPHTVEQRGGLLSAAIPFTPGGCPPQLLQVAIDRTKFVQRSDEPVTVVIPTVGRWHALQRCIASVLPQMRPIDELIIVVNGSTSPPASLVPDGASSLRERRLGASWARNTGWRSARHSCIAFLDDDTQPDRVWLDTMRARLVDADVVTGGVIGGNAHLPIPRTFDSEYALHRGWMPLHVGGLKRPTLAARDTWRVGVGASMAWRRAVLEQLDGFDPALGNGTPGGGAEDLDAFNRAVNAGYQLRYEPRAMVWHWHPDTLHELTQTIHSYQRALGAWGAKRALEATGWRGALELSAQVGDSYRAAARSLTGRSELPALAQLAAGPDALHGAALFVAGRAASRRGDALRPVAVRGDRKTATSVGDLEVDVAANRPYPPRSPSADNADRLLLRNGPHPVAIVDLPQSAAVTDAVGSWARWLSAQPKEAM